MNAKRSASGFNYTSNPQFRSAFLIDI